MKKREVCLVCRSKGHPKENHLICLLVLLTPSKSVSCCGFNGKRLIYRRSQSLKIPAHSTTIPKAESRIASPSKGPSSRLELALPPSPPGHGRTWMALLILTSNGQVDGFYIYIYSNLYTQIHAQISILYLFIYEYTHTHIYIYICTCIYIYIHVQNI